MSVNNPNDWQKESDEQKMVVDEDGEVDRKVKDRILKARENVDAAETELFITRYDDVMAQAPRGTSRAEVDEALADRWSVVVKQYIRAIRPLLKSDEIPRAGYYWEEAPLFDREVPPPPQDGIDWSVFYRSDADDAHIAREMGLDVGMAFEAPEPKQIEVKGLRDLMNFRPRTLYWTVVLNPEAIDPNRTTKTISRRFTLQKGTYEVAVEYADEFLQQANLGLEIGSGDLDSDQLAPDY